MFLFVVQNGLATTALQLASSFLLEQLKFSDLQQQSAYPWPPRSFDSTGSYPLCPPPWLPCSRARRARTPPSALACLLPRYNPKVPYDS